MGVRSNIKRWSVAPARLVRRDVAAHGPVAADRRVALPAGAVILTVVVAAAVSLGSADTHPKRAAAAEPTAKATTQALLPVGTLIQRGQLPRPTLRGDEGTVGVPPKTAARPTKPVDLAAGRTAAQYSGRAGTLTPAGIATLALQRGCSPAQAAVATAVAMAESGGSPSAQGDVTLMTSTWDWSAGLWQIRGLRAQRNTGALRDSVANQNAVTNSGAMYAVSSGCSNWTPWTTYNTGAYRAYLSVAEQAVRYVLAYYRAHHRYPPVAPPDPNATVPIPAGGAGGDPAAAGGPGATSPHRPAHPTSGSTSTRGAGGGGSGGGGGGAGGPATTPGRSAGGAKGSPARPGAPSSSTTKKGLLPPLPIKLPTIPPLKSILPTLPPLPSLHL